MSEVREWAEWYWERGWTPIPISKAIPGDRESGKAPVRGFKWREITTWTREEIQKTIWPNVGIKTGQIIVVDADSEEGLTAARARFGATGTEVITGGNWRHMYFRAPEGLIVRNRVRLWGMGLDIRGFGGYVVAPPSRHYSGGQYRFLRDDGMAMWDSQWLPETEKTTTESLIHPGTELEEAKFRARRYASRIKATQGNRDVTAFKVACVFVQKFGLPPEVALDELRAWCAYCCEPPVPDSRLEYKIKEAIRLNH